MKKGCIRLPETVREGLEVLQDSLKALGWSALAIWGGTLAIVGFIDLKGWSTQEVVSDYTPFLLGLFSIGLTLYLFGRNIKESRERAEHERHASVRPIIIMEGKKLTNDTSVQNKQCFANSATPDGDLILGVENAGLGAALSIEMYIWGTDSRPYRIFPDNHKLGPGEKITIRVQYALPTRIDTMVSRYEDVFGNLHFCEHGIDQEDHGRLQVIGNRYLSVSDVEREGLDKVFTGKHLSQESFVANAAKEKIQQQQNTHQEGQDVTD